jgi:hypothetical protein
MSGGGLSECKVWGGELKEERIEGLMGGSGLIEGGRGLGTS